VRTLGIVGGGITGVTCAYKLQDDFEITLFERDRSLGGHAQTVVVDGTSVESAVSVVGELTFVEFLKLMREIEFDEFESYDLTGLLVHDRSNIKLYIDTNPKRLLKILPRFLLKNPLGLLKTFLLIPFIYRLHLDYRKGKLDGVLVLDAYTLYPRYGHLISTILCLLSLITSVELKNVTIEHVLDFIFDPEMNKGYADPVFQIYRTFLYTKAPTNGVGEYIQKLKDSTNANFKENCEVLEVKRNPDSTVTITDGGNQQHTFDKVIIATQPFQVASFLKYKNAEEQAIFGRLSRLVTNSMVTNHTDSGIFHGVGPTEGLIDFRLDYHDTVPQTTITRANHFYTAQTLPENFERDTEDPEAFVDTGITNDNYSIDPSKILLQRFHSVQHMTPETSELFTRIIGRSGDDNLHFACSVLSNYPTSQEGGVRSALRVVKELT
jgi:predicted NAD/FAD-binding protein